jgi:hypothetical protein
MHVTGCVKKKALEPNKSEPSLSDEMRRQSTLMQAPLCDICDEPIRKSVLHLQGCFLNDTDWIIWPVSRREGDQC